MIANIHKTKKYVLAGGASRHKTRAMHVQVCFSKTFRSAAFRAPSRCSRDIDGEYFAQFAGGSIAIEVIVVRGTHLGTSCRAKTLGPDLVWAVAASDKQGSGIFYERGGTAHVASRD